MVLNHLIIFQEECELFLSFILIIRVYVSIGKWASFGLINSSGDKNISWEIFLVKRDMAFYSSMYSVSCYYGDLQFRDDFPSRSFRAQ